ncbi:MAG TPA: glycosyltransferase family 4 protein [Candidatus Limnocylindrales bacterium]|nr:glycosyltransferase family 4 protein [Candidatus Limnocylindrales bacterium]
MPNYHSGAAGSSTALSEGASSREPGKKSWRVIHACEYARDVLPVIETQITAGMRPYIVTPQGAGAAEVYLSGRQQETLRPLSLLRSWQDVRNWRKSILDCNPEYAADLVHAHSFAAGMAAVRNCSCVVYDVQAFIEELAIATGQCEAGSWMARSFRVAEQFILARAGAVVVHSGSMAEAAHERGAPSESIFVIPDPLPLQEGSISPFPQSPAAADGDAASAIAFFVPALHLTSDGKPDSESLSILKAFNAAADQLDSASLTLVVANDAQPAFISEVPQLTQQGRVRFVESMARGWEVADIVVVPPSGLSLVEFRGANSLCLEAMIRGKAVIAADTPHNRDVSPEGRGCLWYTAGNATDLAARMAFMAENPAFRCALAQSALAFMQESRGPAELGRQYEDAYRHAASRRRTSGPGMNAAPNLFPATQAG